MFQNRQEAGKKLTQQLLSSLAVKQVDKKELLVLSIPRGGVVTGKQVANTLGCDHNVVVVKKIGFPGHEELAIGAIAEDGEPVINRQMANQYGVEADYLNQAIDEVRTKIKHYIEKFRHGKSLNLVNKTVILVDDGIATGETMKAAITWVRSKCQLSGTKCKIIVAVPVCSPDSAKELKQLADEFVCLSTPTWFSAVGQFYADFPQVSDAEVVELLQINKNGKA